MIKLTVKEYATNHQVSTQAVYNMINSGKIEVFEQNGTKYILIDDNEQYKELSSKLQDENKHLKRELELANRLITNLEFTNNVMSRLLPKPDNNEVKKKLKKKKKDK